MRLVGASNFYITMPFLLGAVISALIGVALACLTHGRRGLLLDHPRSAATRSDSSPGSAGSRLALAMLGVVMVGVVLAVIPTLVTTQAIPPGLTRATVRSSRLHMQSHVRSSS